MRVVFAPHAYWPSIGGAERYSQGLAEGLAESGHDVHVVVADVADPEAFYELGHRKVGVPEESLNGVTVHRVSYAGLRYRSFGWLGAEQALQSAHNRLYEGLEAALSRLEPSVVITLPHLFPNVEEVLRLASESRWKVLYAPMLHESDPYWSVERVSEAVGKADGVIALTEHERGRLLSSYGAWPETTVVVAPGVRLAEPGSGSSVAPVVLFLGRRTASKRLEVLYEAMELVWDRHPDARLVIAGSPPVGGSDPATPMLDDERVDVVNSPSDDEKSRLLASARVVANVSAMESFGMTTLEAWSHGTPVVVADTPVNRSVVRDGLDGVLVTTDTAHLADALSLLLAEPQLAESMGEEGRCRARSEFTWTQSVERLEGLSSRL